MSVPTGHPWRHPLANGQGDSPTTLVSVLAGFDGITAPNVVGFSGQRKLLQRAPGDKGGEVESTNERSAERSKLLRERGFTTSTGIQLGSIVDPDVNMTRQASIVGPDSTYNHLYDAILDIPRTRQMYLRCADHQ